MTTRLLTTPQRASFLLSRRPVAPVRSDAPQLTRLNKNLKKKKIFLVRAPGSLLRAFGPVLFASMTPDLSLPSISWRHRAVPRNHSIPPSDVRSEPQRGFNCVDSSGTPSVERLWIVGLCAPAGLFVALVRGGRTPKAAPNRTQSSRSISRSLPSCGRCPHRMRLMSLASQEALRTIEQNLTNRETVVCVIRNRKGLADDDGKKLSGPRAARCQTRKS